MWHPDLLAQPDTRPIEIGEEWENPVTRERFVVVDLPWLNDENRAVGQLTAVPGTRVAGEHMHPTLVERFRVEDGELTLLLDGRKSVLGVGEQVEIQPGVWHDFWNEADRTAIVRVEVTPGERATHLLETLFGLAREGHVNKRGMPHPLQLALLATEFSDIIVFRKPPIAVQRSLFGILAPLARRRGYHGTYPALSRTTLGGSAIAPPPLVRFRHDS
jgi:quercetin dioxygenase-like cupin family protein